MDDNEMDVYEILHLHQDNLRSVEYEIAKLNYEREKIIEEISLTITEIQERCNK